jgi:RNA polymerase sigma-70 factor, ECF subfamily
MDPLVRAVAPADLCPDPWSGAAEDAVVAAAVHDEAAFAELYRRYHPRIFAYLLTYAGNRDEAADLTQHVFLRALEALPSYQPRGIPFGAWLFRIARNAATDAYRYRRRVMPWDHLPERPAPLTETPESLAVRADDLNQMRVLLARLPAHKQELLALSFTSGLPAREIAALIGKSESAVQRQLHRIVHHLQEQFHERQD